MSEAVAAHALRAAEKIRKWQRVAGVVQVSAHSSMFRGVPYSSSACVRLAEPTDHTGALVKAALRAAKRVWREGVEFAKAGVIFHDLSTRDHVQPAPPGVCGISAPPGKRERRLMAAVDHLNRRHDRGTVPVASAGMGAPVAGQADTPLAALHHEARRAGEGKGEDGGAAGARGASGTAT